MDHPLITLYIAVAMFGSSVANGCDEYMQFRVVGICSTYMKGINNYRMNNKLSFERGSVLEGCAWLSACCTSCNGAKMKLTIFLPVTTIPTIQ